MRAFIHDKPVNFRLNGRWLAAAARLADDRGMSLSELMRGAVRDVVASGRSDLPDALLTSADPRQ